MKRTKYTIEQLEPIVKQSISIRQVLIKLGLKECGGNYVHIKQVIEKLGIDKSHFLGQGFAKGKAPHNKRNKDEFIEEILVSHTPINVKGSDIKPKLIKFKLKEDICEHCGQTAIWQNQPLSLQLHHKNGNNKDNRLENLEILCPNCHSQTGTYGNKNHVK